MNIDKGLTLKGLFTSEEILGAVIDRLEAEQKDNIIWKNFLSFRPTRSRAWTVKYGAETGVSVGSVIDRNAKKPLRSRKPVGSGYLEVLNMGDRWQLDNDNLEDLAHLIKDFNQAQPSERGVYIDRIVDIIIRDYKEAYLAPHKRMDLMVGQFLSTGQSIVDRKNNPKGVELKDLKLPVKTFMAKKEDQEKFMEYVLTLIKKENLQAEVMMMNRSTFAKVASTSKEFQNTYKALMGTAEFTVNAGLISEDMANQVFSVLGLPRLILMEEYVTVNDERVNIFEDDRIALLPSLNLGDMRHYKTLESDDHVPNYVYQDLEGDHLIGSLRDENGRMVEYTAAWLPEFYNPTKHAVIKLGK